LEKSEWLTMPEEESISITVRVPRTLGQKIHEKMKRTGFTSLQDYLVYILEHFALQDEESDVYTKEEEEEIKRKLRGMGYL